MLSLLFLMFFLATERISRSEYLHCPISIDDALNPHPCPTSMNGILASSAKEQYLAILSKDIE